MSHRRRRLPILAATSAALLALTALADRGPVAGPPDNRTISLRNIHTDETVSVEYKRGRDYVPAAMEKINWVLRDWRRNEPTRMDPALVDLLWEMHAELGSKMPINIISGFRSRGTNDMLRRTVGGQASESRHILGKAADVQFPDVPIRQLRYAAMIRERGGVGYYPTSATPFVHVDTDRIRAWPRMPRLELALLFPSGRTQHMPSNGGPLTVADAREARAQNPDLAQQVAVYHALRSGPRPVLVAASDTKPAPAPRTGPVAKPAAIASIAPPPPPKLLAEPRLIDRPTRLTSRPSEQERQALAQLTTLASLPELIAPPRLAARPAPAGPAQRMPEAVEEDAITPGASLSGGTPPLDLPQTTDDRSTPSSAPLLASIGAALTRFATAIGWSTAPEFDEDHPEEVSYRPFPIAPYLTETASPDDPALVSLVHPDVSRTLELLDSDGASPPMTLRPGAQVAQLLWAQRFYAVVQLEGSERTDAAGLASRHVRTAREQ